MKRKWGEGGAIYEWDVSTDLMAVKSFEHLHDEHCGKNGHKTITTTITIAQHCDYNKCTEGSCSSLVGAHTHARIQYI